MIRTLAVAIALTLVCTGEGRAWRVAEKLEFVQELSSYRGLPGLALCRLVEETTHYYIFTTGREERAYVVAPGRCAGDQYLSLEDGELEQLKAQGIVAADLPELKPPSSMGWLKPIAIAGLGLVVLVFLRGALGQGAGREAARSATGAQKTWADRKGTGYAGRLFEVACRAATAVGRTDDVTLGQIVALGESARYRDASPEKAREVIDRIRFERDASLDDIGIGLGEGQRRELMQVAMRMIGKPNLEDPRAKAFLDKLALGLLILPEERAYLASLI